MEPKLTVINGTWKLKLPPDRADRLGWDVWEKERLAALFAAIRSGDVVLDIGSEAGDFSALFSSWGADTILVEPTEKYWPVARYIFDQNTLRAPLYSFVGFASDLKTYHDLTRRQGELIRGWPKESEGGFTSSDPGFCHLHEREDIPQISVDAVLDQLEVDHPGRTINVLTIDTEGSEYHVLLGAERLLTQHSPTVFVSIHPETIRNDYGMTPDDVVAHMEIRGYQTFYLAYDHERHFMFKKKA